MTWGDVQKECPGLTASKLQGIPDGCILFFWASSASFVVEHQAEFWYPFQIIDSEGQNVGQLEGDWSRATDDLQDFVVIGREDWTNDPDSTPRVEALQIHWEDGIAYRVNHAMIEEQAWMEADPVWKLIALM